MHGKLWKWGKSISKHLSAFLLLHKSKDDVLFYMWDFWPRFFSLFYLFLFNDVLTLNLQQHGKEILRNDLLSLISLLNLLQARAEDNTYWTVWLDYKSEPLLLAWYVVLLTSSECTVLFEHRTFVTCLSTIKSM